MDMKWLNKLMEKAGDRIALISLAILGIASFGLVIVMLRGSEDVKELGPAGDFFGGILNPILSFIAFIAVVISFNAQARISLKSEQASTKVLQGQEEQLKQLVLQGALAERQAFENVLFGLIQHYANNVSSVKLDLDGASEHGRFALETLSKRFTVDDIDLIKHQAARPWQRLDVVYKKFYEVASYGAGHCFGAACQVIKFIESADYLAEGEKQRYADMYFSLLSVGELKCILYYVVAQDDFTKFDLLDKYGFMHWQRPTDVNALNAANYLGARRHAMWEREVLFSTVVQPTLGE